MKLKIFLSIISLLLITIFLGGIKGLQIFTMIEAGKAMDGPPPETVQLGQVKADQWESSLQAIGSVSAINGTDIRAEVSGIIERIHFDAGQDVKEGDLLIELNADTDQASLDATKATADYAKNDLLRKRELFARKSISQAELDYAESTYDAAIAEVARQKAYMAKKFIHAPFSGTLGIRNISKGEYISAGQKLVSLQSLDQVYVNFTLPQKELTALSQNDEIRIQSDAFPGEIFKGKLQAIDPKIDPISRNLQLQAILDNPDRKLKPGMFVNVSIIAPEKRNLLMIPRSAILHATYGNTVFVVPPNQPEDQPRQVRQKIVRTGETRGDFIEITSGLSEGDIVVISGNFKLRDKSMIVTSDLGTLNPELEPHPEQN